MVGRAAAASRPARAARGRRGSRWRGRAPTIASISAPDLAFGRRRRGALDLLDADRRPLRRARARASRARAAAAAGGRPPARRAPARPRRRAPPRAGPLLDDPARQLPRLERRLGGDVAAGLLHRRHELRRHLRPTFLAGEEGDRRVGGMSASTGASDASISASFQRSTPSTMRKRRPIANVIAHSASRDGLRRGRVALEHLDPAHAGLRLGERAQLRAALGDAAVLVAVDQVGGLEGRHPSESRSRAAGTAATAVPPRRPSRMRRHQQVAAALLDAHVPSWSVR